MAPKIEEVKEKQPLVKPNPFAINEKKATIRRDPKDLYSTKELRKGLHTPEYNRGSPLDKVFLDLEKKIDGDLDELSLDVLCDRILSTPIEDVFERRYNLVDALLNYLIDIQDCSITETPNKDLISISLHDIKTFSKLINIIIIHAIYPAINTFKIGIPIAKRRLNDFSKTKKPTTIDQLPQNNHKTYVKKFENNERLLGLAYTKLKHVFSKESDAKDLLIKGTGYSDFLTISITLITCPYFDQSKKPSLLKEFNDFVIQLPSTYELFQTYTLYMTSPSPPFFKLFVLHQLGELHYSSPKGDGLLSLIEFVLGLRENEDINVEKFDHVANGVLLKPKHITTINYFSKIGKDMFDLLANINRPNITSCVGHILERLWLKNKLVTQDFFLKIIWNNLNPSNTSNDDCLVSEKNFNDTINVLISLQNKGLSPDLTQFLFKPILLSLWGYYTFLLKTGKPYDVILNIITTYFITLKDHEDLENDFFGLDKISKSLVFSSDSWEYNYGPNNLPIIVKKSIKIGSTKDEKMNTFFNDLDSACKAFITLLKGLDDTYVFGIFKIILKRWLKLGQNENVIGTNEDENPLIILIDLRLVESIANDFKEDIAKTPNDMLIIAEEFLSSSNFTIIKKESDDKDSDDEDSDDEDDFDSSTNEEVFPILLELVSAIMEEAKESAVDSKTKDLLISIIKHLKRIGKKQSHPIVERNKNSIDVLINRIESVVSGETKEVSVKSIQRKNLSNIIANLNDPLVPIRAHGLYLLRQMIEEKSEVLSLDFAINLHLMQLKDEDPFIFLNVIKGLESLIDFSTKDVIPILLKIYTNEDKNTNIDERLKIGEVLLRYIRQADGVITTAFETTVNGTLDMIRRYPDPDRNQDDRIRMSSMSLLGECCKVNPSGISARLTDVLDCAIGILQLEKDHEKAIMRRSAVVLIHDLVIGTSNSSQVPFPNEYKEKVVIILKYISETDSDVLTREQAITVLEDIDELTKLAFEELK